MHRSTVATYRLAGEDETSCSIRREIIRFGDVYSQESVVDLSKLVAGNLRE